MWWKIENWRIICYGRVGGRQGINNFLCFSCLNLPYVNNDTAIACNQTISVGYNWYSVTSRLSQYHLLTTYSMYLKKVYCY